jgi:hypothetical protein
MLNILKSFVPLSALNFVRRLRAQLLYGRYKDQTCESIFSDIYRHNRWGAAEEKKFYSGTGSHDASVVSPYLNAVASWLRTFSTPPDTVDLGCGDFSVGSRLRNLCGRYTAADVVPAMIENHRLEFSSLKVDFIVCDISRAELPAGDVVFIRQVLQHLSNEAIHNVVRQLASRYKYAVVTEHLPKNPDLVPNIDKKTGPDTRIGYNSAVVLTAPPFGLQAKEQRVICEVPENGGVIQTVIYTF